MKLSRNFYQKTRPRVHRRIVHELRCAQSVVDIGCGACDLGELLAKWPGRRVMGVDISSAAFPPKRKRGRQPECVRGDARALRFIKTNSVDAVVSVWSLHEMSAPMAVLREARRVLRPCGEILVVDFPRGSLAQRLWNERYYTTGRVAQMLRRAGFVRVEARRIARKQLTWARGFKPPIGN